MRLEPVRGDGAREVLRALRSAIHGAGPAVALGGTATARTSAAGWTGGGSGSSQTSDAGSTSLGERTTGEVPAGTAVVLATSGSTGHPKRVVLSRSALTASALATAARIGEGAWLLALPATYIAGVQVLVRAIVSGREPAVLAGRFSPQAFAAAAATMASSERGERVPAYTSLVPAQLQTLLDAADAGIRTGLTSFETVLVGGQSLAPALRERAERAGVRLVRTYGSSETSGGCVYDGVALDGVGMRIVDGEVQLSGPTLADGYLDDPERTASVFPCDADGTRWYRTGDAGEVSGGVLRVTGRLDNVIVSGGVNVSLDRVEQVVRTVPGLEHAVVVAVPDERWGEASVIVVPGGALAGREPAALAAARTAVAAALGAPARPARLVAVDAVPVLASGKPDLPALRRIAGSALPRS
ncbi:AMP-binding protein [Microbacterium sp.]|uniref:AMP-binding protein n=1 Tax=Microbacterium sp. TaxID=51671 RepID=UPI0039E52FE2